MWSMVRMAAQRESQQGLRDTVLCVPVLGCGVRYGTGVMCRAVGSEPLRMHGEVGMSCVTDVPTYWCARGGCTAVPGRHPSAGPRHAPERHHRRRHAGAADGDRAGVWRSAPTRRADVPPRRAAGRDRGAVVWMGDGLLLSRGGGERGWGGSHALPAMEQGRGEKSGHRRGVR